MLLLIGPDPAWAAQSSKPSEVPAFFPFCIDWHDAKKRDFVQQAQMLKELGYDGVGHIWLDKIEERIASLDAAGLKLFQITIQVDIAPGKQAYDPRLKETLRLVKGRGDSVLSPRQWHEAIGPRWRRTSGCHHPGNVRAGQRLGCAVSALSTH